LQPGNAHFLPSAEVFSFLGILAPLNNTLIIPHYRPLSRNLLFFFLFKHEGHACPDLAFSPERSRMGCRMERTTKKKQSITMVNLWRSLSKCQEPQRHALSVAEGGTGDAKK
jgi:hypothetical protein